MVSPKNDVENERGCVAELVIVRSVSGGWCAEVLSRWRIVDNHVDYSCMQITSAPWHPSRKTKGLQRRGPPFVLDPP
jgi:hypothetical protein